MSSCILQIFIKSSCMRAAQMHYEGSVAISTFGNVDTFGLTDDILRSRWATLILAFSFSCTGLAVPQDWFGSDLKPKSAEVNNFPSYHARLHAAVARLPEPVFRKKLLGCLKVRSAS